jgi:1-acyl-sn-glycerol-3-phosphate acyltransferase
LIRRLKGVYMALMFALFAIGIFLNLALVLPVLFVVRLLRGSSTTRMEATLRFLLGLWLRLLAMGGLLVVEAPIGRPVDGASVIVANHPGLFDVLVLICEIPNMSLLVKRSLSRSLPVGPIIRASGYVLSPDPSHAGTMLRSFREAVGHLQAGRSFQLFPEGTRSPVGGLRTFQRGAVKMAQLAQVPIQPVFIHNTPPFMPHEDPWYLPNRRASRIRLEFLPPLPPPSCGGEAEVTRSLEALFLTHSRGLGESSKLGHDAGMELGPVPDGGEGDVA